MAAAPSAWRWPRRSTGLGVGRSWSWKARTGCSREEPFAGEELRAAFEAEGIAVVTGARMTAARRLGRDGPVVASLADGREFTGDEILVAVGRRPATADLGLEHVGLEPGRPVGVDQAPRAVGVPGGWLYAIGDCTGLALSGMTAEELTGSDTGRGCRRACRHNRCVTSCPRAGNDAVTAWMESVFPDGIIPVCGGHSRGR